MSYEYRNYGQARNDARKFALYLQEEGLRPGTGMCGLETRYRKKGLVPRIPD